MKKEIAVPEPSTIWTIVNSLSFDKKDSSATMEEDEFQKLYTPFIINRALSQHADTVLYANEMNILPFLPKKMQHDFYLFGLRARKRFGKWAKANEEKNITVVCEYYNCGVNKAREMLQILTEDQVSELKSRMFRGGLQKPSHAK